MNIQRACVAIGWIMLFEALTVSCYHGPPVLRNPAKYGSPSYDPPVAAAPLTTKLMLFGGTGHKVYLGCLNCSQYATDSIRNAYGENGSPYSSTSILNKYGDYGSPYSDDSACNPYASNPPVIVDQAGGFHGRLTVNANHLQRTQSSASLAWIQGVCAR